MEAWTSTESVFAIKSVSSRYLQALFTKAMSGGLALSIVCDPNLPTAVEGHRDSPLSCTIEI